MSKLYNRARMTITSTGTGALSLGVAVAGYQTFSSAGAQNNDVVSYTIEDGLNWEIGTGTYNSVAGTLSRTVTQSYNGTTYGTTAISVTTNAQVFISALAADLQYGTSAYNLVQLDSNAKIPALDGSQITNLNVGNAASGTLSVSRGGTGISSFGTGVATALGNNTNAASGLAVLNSSGALAVGQGGTGLTSLTAGYIPYASSSSAFSFSNLYSDGSNLGLGVTPSAWSGIKSLDIGKSGSFYGDGIVITWTSGLTQNAYYNSGWKYRYSSIAAQRYEISNNSHQWYIDAASGGGTAGGTITFTQAMTLDASGNLGIGTTTPSSYTTRCAAVASLDYGASFTAVSNSSAANWARIDLKNVNVATNTYLYKDQSGLMGLFNEGAHAMTFGTNNTERMRIDSSGNLLVGQTSVTNTAKLCLTQATAYASNTYNTVASTVGTSTVYNQQQSTSVSTTATVILTPNLYASFCVVFGSDGTNRFMDLIIGGLGNGTIGVVSSFSVAGSPAARTYSQSGSTYRLAMASGTYTVQVAALSMNG